jgi:hypothetical protein
MRFDALLRYRSTHGDSDGDLLTTGATLAFRPRPTLDFQIFVEIPLYQRIPDLQMEEGPSFFFAFGFRI